MNVKSNRHLIRILMLLCVGGSIAMMYYVFIVKQEYKVFTNPDGPVLEEAAVIESQL